MTLQVHFLAILLVLEILLVLAGLCAFFWWRGRNAVRALAGMPADHEIEREEEWNYAAWLRDELIKTKAMADAAPAAETAEGDGEGSEAVVSATPKVLYGLRHKFLALELRVDELRKDEAGFKAGIEDGLRELLEHYRLPAVVEAAAETEESTPTVSVVVNRNEEELDRLKGVIDNQQDIMRALRESLDEQAGESPEWAEIQKKLEAAERQSTELTRCVNVLEKENDRLKHSTVVGGKKRANESASANKGTGGGEDFSGLRSLIGDQQETIGNLHQMIQGLVPEAGKAKELETLVNRMQRANQELNGCLMVLEDENEMLRKRVESMEGQGEAPAAEMDPEERKALITKMHDLEVQLEFRDLSLAELKKENEQLEQELAAFRGEAKAGTA